MLYTQKKKRKLLLALGFIGMALFAAGDVLITKETKGAFVIRTQYSFSKREHTLLHLKQDLQ